MTDTESKTNSEDSLKIKEEPKEKNILGSVAPSDVKTEPDPQEALKDKGSAVAIKQENGCKGSEETSSKVETEPHSHEALKDKGSAIAIKKENGCKGSDKVSETKSDNQDQSNKECVVKTAEENNDPNLEAKIVRQIEYYFGDINLPKDKYLLEQVKLDDGWVPLEVMLRFRRLKALSSKPETIISCLKSSSTLMEVSEDKTKLRRLPSQPLPDFSPEYVKEVQEKTLYCKGFPQSLDDIDVLLEFFSQYGPVDNVDMRRYTNQKTQQKRIFKGSVYVTFKTKELAEKFLALESVSYEGKELIRMTRAAHVEEQKREKDERWGKKIKPKKTEDASNTTKNKLPKGCILKVGPIKNASTSRDNIKEALVACGAEVAFIQYDKGDTEAYVRLQSTEDGAATKFIKSLEDSGQKVKIDTEMEITQLDGEEEDAFLKKTMLAFENSQKGYSKRGRNRGGRGGYQGRRRPNKRAGSPIPDNATPAKVAASSE